MGKSENYILFGNCSSHRPQSWFKYSNKWVNEVKWVLEVKVIIWPWPKVTYISKIKTCFSQKLFSYLEPNFFWKLMSEWEWKFIQMSRVTWTRWLPCPYMVKAFKNLLLQNQSKNDLGLWYVALGTWVLPRLFKWWPWVDHDLLRQDQIWENAIT